MDSVVADAEERISLIAIDRSHERIVGIGSWCETEPCSGEIGLLVEDAYQSCGIGTQLLRGLVRAARARGSMTFEAVVLRGQVGLALRMAGPAAERLHLDPHGEVTALRTTIPPPAPLWESSEGRASDRLHRETGAGSPVLAPSVMPGRAGLVLVLAHDVPS